MAGVYVAGGHAWQGVCMVGACMPCMPPADTTRYGDTVNERPVRILLECILVYSSLLSMKNDLSQLDFFLQIP